MMYRGISNGQNTLSQTFSHVGFSHLLMTQKYATAIPISHTAKIMYHIIMSFRVVFFK